MLFGEIPERLATETDHLQRIRTYLGWRPFNDEARVRLTRWLTPRATDDVLPYDLMARAEDILQTWQVILPASSTLEELIASVTARVQDEVYPRYFGYYDQALTVYTHLADQHSVFHIQVIACSVHEAIHVLDGLLANDTILRPKGHFVDQHGYTDQLFGLCHLLGYSLRPRLNVSKQTLYKLDRGTSYGHLDAVFAGAIEVALIREQWDQLVRVAASLRNRTAPAPIVLTRFASSAPSDRLAKALTTLGQALRTLYLLRYIHEEPLRARMQLQINRGEGRHQLVRRLFFANQRACQTGDYEEIMNKATCLSLLSNAVLVWNTVHMMHIIQRLRASGETITAEELARISSMVFSHVIPNGTYFTRRKALEPEGDHDGQCHPLDLEKMGSDAERR